jgi:hypothetical protein
MIEVTNLVYDDIEKYIRSLSKIGFINMLEDRGCDGMEVALCDFIYKKFNFDVVVILKDMVKTKSCRDVKIILDDRHAFVMRIGELKEQYKK